MSEAHTTTSYLLISCPKSQHINKLRHDCYLPFHFQRTATNCSSLVIILHLPFCKIFICKVICVIFSYIMNVVLEKKIHAAAVGIADKHYQITPQANLYRIVPSNLAFSYFSLSLCPFSELLAAKKTYLNSF